MKKVLVTGGAGFIGSHLVDALIEAGIYEVDVVDDFSTGRIENKNPKANYFILSVEDMDKEQFTGYEIVYHLAARARIQPSIQDPYGASMANVMGTIAALEVARACKAHFVMSSSSSVYGCDEKIPLSEDRELHPRSPYALSKQVDEMYCNLYEELYGLKVTIFRYFNVFGERQLANGAYATVLGIFKAHLAFRDPLPVVGDGEQRRDFTYVKDVVSANVMAFEKGFTGLYNVGTGENTSINEIADALAGPDYPRQMGVVRTAEVRETKADNARLLAQGWKPSMSVIEWINQPMGYIRDKTT